MISLSVVFACILKQRCMPRPRSSGNWSAKISTYDGLAGCWHRFPKAEISQRVGEYQNPIFTFRVVFCGLGIVLNSFRVFTIWCTCIWNLDMS
mmetsp:Transcript_80899/g.135340  ORF Transcript_80899/g.135340 Transcript_80899/m.135340 type:complete len:93 (-) Transcript_80899:62-340(-)